MKGKPCHSFPTFLQNSNGIENESLDPEFKRLEQEGAAQRPSVEGEACECWGLE